ncbi:MAG: YihY/virulence factor BrkB family protein [Halobacteriaceae archaeon]
MDARRAGRESRDVLVRVVRVARRENVGFLAAAVAYYAFVSIVPLLLLALAVGSTLGGDRLASAVVAAVGDLLAPAGRDLLREAIVGGDGRGEATVVSVALLLWSGLRLFRGLDTAFSQVYGAATAEPLGKQLRDAALVLGSIALSVGAVAAIGGLLPATLPAPGGELVAAVSLPVALTAAFVPVFYYFPDTPVTVREVLPGAALAAVAWAGLVGVFRVYAANAAQYELYGVLGGVLLLVTWLYLAATVIILGAILNAVLAGRVDDGGGTTGDAGLRTDGGVDGADDVSDGPGGVGDGPGDDAAVGGDGAGGPGGGEGTDTGGRDDAGTWDVASGGDARAGRAPSAAELGAEVDELAEEVDALRERLEERTVHRAELESDLRRYVRARLRRGHARGWGPYLVLLYGTAMTVAAFHFLSGGWAVAAMLVVWLSTLGLYALMLVVGVGLRAAEVPMRAYDWLAERRG